METHRLLAALRKNQGKSYADLATPAGLSRIAVMRAEKENHPLIRGETLDAILSKGHGFGENHPQYKKIVASWTRDKLKPARRPAKSLEDKVAKLSPAKRKVLEKFLREM